MTNAPAAPAPPATTDRFMVTCHRGTVLVADIRGFDTMPPASRIRTREEAWREAINYARRYSETTRLVIFTAAGDTRDVTDSPRWQKDLKAARDRDRRAYFARVA